MRGSLSQSISAPGHDGVGGCPNLVVVDPASFGDGQPFSHDLVSEKRLGGVRTTTRSRNSMRVYLDRSRGLERPLEVHFQGKV